MKQLRLEQRRVEVYNRGYVEEMLLRQLATYHLQKHERLAFGSVQADAQKSTESGQAPLFPVPKTPERDISKEDLPWYWRSDDDEKIPRTPPYQDDRKPNDQSESSTRNVEPKAEEVTSSSRNPLIEIENSLVGWNTITQVGESSADRVLRSLNEHEAEKKAAGSGELFLQLIASGLSQDIKTSIAGQTACTMLFKQMMMNQNEKLIAEAAVMTVCVNRDLKPRRVPTMGE
jgi:hypothetical protein